MKNKMISMITPPPPPPPLNKCLVEYRAFLQGAKKTILSVLLASSFSLVVFFPQCSSSSDNSSLPDCGTDELIQKLKADSPSLSGCSPGSIRNADMTALTNAGVTKAQFLGVWSENPDTGFSSAQLLEARVSIADMRSHGLSISQIHAGGVSIAELRSGGVANYLVFNEACNTPQTSGTAPGATLRLTSTPPLSSTATNVRLEGKGDGSVRWELSGVSGRAAFVRLFDSPGDTKTLGSATAEYLRDEGDTIVSRLTIPLANVFSNPTLSIVDQHARRVQIRLCPGT